jgi:metal-responsive CopG/Arc/MetJ family transcriptional regulator
MKAIQVTFDEALLRRLDADDEVRRDGRSAVLRRAVEQYLAGRRKHRIGAAYRKAYAGNAALSDLAGWEDEGAWPEP